MDEKSQWRKEREIDVSGKVRKQLHFSWKICFQENRKERERKFGEERERERRETTMANLLAAALPSSDEEDDDYDPTLDLAQAKKREKEELLNPKGGKGFGQGPRARVGGLEELPELAEQRKKATQTQQGEAGIRSGSGSGSGSGIGIGVGDEGVGLRDRNASGSWRELSRKRQREARVEQAWETLKGATTSISRGEGTSEGLEKKRKKEKENTTAGDETTSVGNGSSAESKKAFAAEAIRTMKEASKFGFRSSGKKGQVLVKETRNFAGKSVEVIQEVDASSKSGAKAIEKSKQSEKKKGLDYVLQLLDRKRKLNIIDKSKLDWKEYKRDHKQVQEELNAYTKGGERYTERQDFLKRTEMREYEIERDNRLASSTRLRGRL